MYIHGACNLGHGNVNSSDTVLTHSSKVVNWSKDQLLPRPDRARISGPEGPEILVLHIYHAFRTFMVRNNSVPNMDKSLFTTDF